MNRDRLNWGLVLLFIGIMWLLSNLGFISFYWSSLWRFWPIFLIILGVNLLVPRQGVGNIISVVATIAALVFIGFQSSHPRNDWNRGATVYENDEDIPADREDRGEIRKADFVSPYESHIKTANLEIKGGAVEYKIAGETDDLFKAETKSAFAGHVLQSSVRDSVADLSFRMKNVKKKEWNLDENENSAEIALNVKPFWNIRVDVGAGAVDFDLSKYKIAKLDLKGGAASFEAKLGNPIGVCEISAESGVASVEIEIPKEAPCRIEVKSGLSSKEFPGFIKQDDGSYITEGFQESGNRYLINLKGGLSSFSVQRY